MMNLHIFNMAIAEHHQNVDNAIAYLINLWKDGVNIKDESVFNKVIEKYGLNDDGFESERNYIIQEVSRRINR